MTYPTCKTCVYFTPVDHEGKVMTESSVTVCRRYPPLPLALSSTRGYFPRVRHYEWCGEHKVGGVKE